MKQNSNLPLLLLTILTLTILITCEPASEVNGECYFDARSSCSGTSWSFVDPDTYENLMGYEDRPIHPDSIHITNIDGDTMYHSIYSFMDGWMDLEGFSPFQELYCFNQCELDSAFSRFYFMSVGCNDIDTIEARFAVHTRKYAIFFNGMDGSIPKDKPAEMPGYSVFWFRKKIKN